MAVRGSAIASLFVVACSLTLVACAGMPLVTDDGIGDARAHFPEFWEKARARLDANFRGRDVAARAQLGPGRWQSVVRIDVDYTGVVHGCKLLRSSGFNAIDDEAMQACRSVKEELFPPEGAIESDALAHVPIPLVVEVKAP